MTMAGHVITITGFTKDPYMIMKKALISIALLAFSSVSYSGITVYYDPANNLQAEADYLAALAAYATITESFEDDAVWGP